MRLPLDSKGCVVILTYSLGDKEIKHFASTFILFPTHCGTAKIRVMWPF